MKCSKSYKCSNFSKDAYICNYSQDYGERCYKYNQKKRNLGFFMGYLFGAVFCLIICLLAYFLFLGQSPSAAPPDIFPCGKKVGGGITEGADEKDKDLLIELSGRFLELHPYNESQGYQCLQIAKDFKAAVSEFGYQPEIEIGCTNESKESCHAWLSYNDIEIYGRRENYPIKLSEETERYFLSEG